MSALIKISVAVLVMALAGSAVFQYSRPSYESRFHELFDYEAQNRLFANATTGHRAEP